MRLKTRLELRLKVLWFGAYIGFMGIRGIFCRVLSVWLEIQSHSLAGVRLPAAMETFT